MQFLTTFFTLATLSATVFAQTSGIKNNTQEYYLKTKLKPNQPGKDRFDALYLQAYHTGAGLNDATFGKKEGGAIPGFLNGTNGKSGDITYSNQVFDLGSNFASSLMPETNDVMYASWQPVRINSGGGSSAPNGSSGFYFNSTGLQWTSAPSQKPAGAENEFGGWLVCNWWHANSPQLFFRMKPYSPSPIPCSCADVYLMPQYI